MAAADASPPPPPPPRALAGLEVLELGQLIAGPFCTRILGEFGAAVTKIEPPGQGDPLRKWRHLKDGTSLWWHVQSRGKRSVALDLRQPEAQEIVRRLAAKADIVVENFKVGTMERMGLGYEDVLRPLNPRAPPRASSGIAKGWWGRLRPSWASWSVFVATTSSSGSARAARAFPASG